jgi:PHS family inorganic phosphate transporter-like MFS transporter
MVIESLIGSPDEVSEALDEAPLSRTHLRVLVASGLGFFTDAYDLFIIGTAAVVLRPLWHLSVTEISMISSATLLGAFAGALVLGRLADLVGRRRVYRLVAVLMVVGSIAAACAPDLAMLIAARLLLGFGIGGDYPVSAVLMSEYANRRQRGTLVSLLFSMQAVGLVVGPLVGMILLSSGLGSDLVWRLMLGLGAIPAVAAILTRRRIAESPRYLARVTAEAAAAAPAATTAVGGRASPTTAHARVSGFGATMRDDLGADVGPDAAPRFWNRGNLALLVGTAGAWFAFDYAYYGNTISTPLVLKAVAPHAALVDQLGWALAIFAAAAVPGYVLAFVLMDRIGHRRLQFIGFCAMGAALLGIALLPGVATEVVPFLVLYAISYFFAEFGPNTTTFVLPGEVFPTRFRTSAHGLSAGIAKFGAFIGVFLLPVLVADLGLRGALAISAGAALVGIACTALLPEPARRSLDEVTSDQLRRDLSCVVNLTTSDARTAASEQAVEGRAIKARA